MNPTRREFTKALLAFSASSLLPFSVAHAAGEAALQMSPRKKLLVGSGHIFCVIDLEKNEVIKQVPLQYFPHSFLPEPKNPERVWSVQRRNYEMAKSPVPMASTEPYISRASAVNIRTGEVELTVEAEANSGFRGHGLFASGGDVIFISRVEHESGKGYLTGYDVKDGKKVADYNVSPAGIHECRLLQDGTVLLATPGQKYKDYRNPKLGSVRVDKNSIDHFDLNSGKLLSRMVIDNDEQLVGHFHLLKNNDIIAIAQTGYEEPIAPLAFVGKLGDKTLSPVHYNEAVPSLDTPGELFNLTVDEDKGVAVISSLATSRLLLLDIAERTYIQAIPFRNPWGASYDKDSREFVVNGFDYVALVNEALTRRNELQLTNTGKYRHFASGHNLLV